MQLQVTFYETSSPWLGDKNGKYNSENYYGLHKEKHYYDIIFLYFEYGMQL